MPGWALTLLIVAFLAAVLGFSGLLGVVAGVARMVSTVFLLILLLSFLAGWRIKRLR